MIKGQTYSSQLFENWAYRLTFDTILNGNNGVLEQYGNKMQVTATNNNIVVGSGLAVIQGGIIENTSDLTLVPQLQANEYYRVVVEIDMSQTNTESEFNQGSIKLISNSGGYPALTKQDTIQGTGIYQYELARFQTTSSAIQNLTDTRTYLNYNSLYQELRNAIDDVIQGGINAEQVAYDNSTSGLPSTNVQGAIDNLKQTDTTLQQNFNTLQDNFNNLNVTPKYQNDIVMVEHTFTAYDLKPYEEGAGTRYQNISKVGYKPVGIVGSGKVTAGMHIGDIFLSASNNGSGTIRAYCGNGSNPRKHNDCFGICFMGKS